MKNKKAQPETQPQAQAITNLPAIGTKGVYRLQTPNMTRPVFIKDAECVDVYQPRPDYALLSIKFFDHAKKEVAVWQVSSKNIQLMK